ncbi:MAG: SpoIIE family protein phosphatase, partial [Pseudomonadota bacterium]
MTASVSLTCSEVWGSNKATETVLVLPGLEGWITAQPHEGEAAGGDVHYVSSCGTGRITRVLLADVSGHGSIVADVSENLRLLMQRYLNHVDPNKLAQRLNEQWSKQFAETGRFATAILLTYWAPTGGFSVCSAGHPMPLLYRAERKRWVAIDEPDDTQKAGAGIANLPLGVVEDSGYLGRQLNLRPG